MCRWPWLRRTGAQQSTASNYQKQQSTTNSEEPPAHRTAKAMTRCENSQTNAKALRKTHNNDNNNNGDGKWLRQQQATKAKKVLVSGRESGCLLSGACLFRFGSNAAASAGATVAVC